MRFSIVLIVKNEEKTLPKLFGSLRQFKDRGGEICLLDTGSTDNTINIAQEFGCKTYSKRCEQQITFDQAAAINARYCKGDEPAIVQTGDVLFNYAAARNFINMQASNDMVCTLDADEAYTTFDIDAINKLIDEGYEQFEYQFVYAHDPMGRPAIQFIQSKFFNRKKAYWSGIVHEVVRGDTNRKYLDESIIKLEHYQQPGKEHRGKYLPGLALDCYNNPVADRQSHYFARELMYSGRYKSAIAEFEHHITLGGWVAERAQSMIHMGQCYGHLGDPQNQAEWYFKAFYADPARRAALMELALFFRHQDLKPAAAAFAAAALEIPFSDYYANDRAHFENLPHEILYWAKGWMGDVPAAQHHLLKALEYQPYHLDYLRDTKFYFEYPDNGIDGWMRFPELQWLYGQAKKRNGGRIVEVGSWKGKSAHALASGNKTGQVFCVDTWQGSEDSRDATNALAKQENVYEVFCENTKQFENIVVWKRYSLEAANIFDDHSLDMVFIDAGHTKDEVKADIEAWLPKVKTGGLICGHDYEKNTWMTVCEGVDSVLEIDGVCDSIWFKTVTSTDAVLQAAENRPDINRIPKRIATAWLSDNDEIPAHVQNYIETQKIPGYKHTLRQAVPTALMTGYLGAAVKAKKWVKAVDYLRMVDLYEFGGIFLDADVEILEGKNFDDLLHEEMFVGAEVINPDGTIVLGTAIIGAVKGHPLIKEWIETVEANFKGDTDDYYESSMDVLNRIGVKYQDRMRIIPPDYFYPYNHFTQQYHRTSNTIAIHHFMKSWVPEKESLTIYDLQKWIETGKNFTFVKRGDGELACMNGVKGENCDGHEYTIELRMGLTIAYEQLQKAGAIIVEFADQANYNMLLHRDDNDLVAVSEFYKTIGRRHREVFLIGPAKLQPFAQYLDALFIEVPEKNNYRQYLKVYSTIPKVKDAIYLFCAGMASKVFIADLYALNPDATYIDAGSALDPSVRQTRTYQITKDQFWALYQKDNFKIPQQRHPERRFALRNIPDQAKIILDLGCGGNKTMGSAIGIDLRPGVTDQQGDIQDLSSFGSATVDVVISRHSFEHLQDPVKAMKEWIRVLKPGGRMIVVLPDHGAINTLDQMYSAGQHLHTYTIESFTTFLSMFAELTILEKGIVLKNWSFGFVISKAKQWPRVSIIIPTLGRQKGLERCLKSISNLNYSGAIDVIPVYGPSTVPEKMKSAYKDCKGEIICYAANDMEFTMDSLGIAVEKMQQHNYDLVAFNTGQLPPNECGFCEHFIIKKEFVDLYLDGEIFDTRLKHCGVDNLLWAKVQKYGSGGWAEKAIVYHYHFSRGGEMDEVYEKGWGSVDQDRKTLKQLLNEPM